MWYTRKGLVERTLATPSTACHGASCLDTCILITALTSGPSVSARQHTVALQEPFCIICFPKTQHCGFAAAALQQLLPQDTTHSCFAAAAANGEQTLQLLHNRMGGCWPAEKSQSQLLPCSCFSRMLCSKLESSVSSQQKRLIGTWQLKIYELVTDVHELCDPMARDHRGSGSLVTVSASSLKSFVLAFQVSGFWIW